ncbi:MAG: methyltransferase domain-containing protein [Ginsengibacter sp.]
MINQLKKIIPGKVRQEINRLKHLLILNRHKGNKYICPFCNYSSKDLFLLGFSFPVLKEKQVIGGSARFGGCYKCRSSDRERLIYIYLKEKLHIFQTDKIKSILHIAPEKHLRKILFAFGFFEYVCGDLFTESYSYPEYVKNINILDIPYSDNTFDLIICNHVLEHIPTDLAAMRELSRVLKIGGQAILQVPISNNSATTFEDFSVTDPKQREITFGQFDHSRIYGQDYVTRLEQSGFKVIRINISQEFMKYGLNKEEDIFVCYKNESTA